MIPQPPTQQNQLAALYEVSAKLGETLELEALLNLVMDSIIQLTGGERGYLMLADEISGEAQTRVARNVDQTSLLGKSMEVSRTVLQRAMHTGAPILTDNAQEDERFANHQSVVGYQLRSIMCAPLRARGRVIGAVYVDNRLFAGVFGAKDLELLEAFTNQAAIAIDNARLFARTDQQLARRVEELTLFQQIDRELNRSLDLDRVLRLALDWAVKLTNANGGSLGLVQDKMDVEGKVLGQVLALRAYLGNSEGEGGEVPAFHPIVAQILAEKEPVHTKHATDEQAIDGTAASAQLAVPILRKGAVTGLIALESESVNAFTADDIAFVTRLADRAAVAIENARLYQVIAAANKAKSDFISIVTHELRLPMTSIKGYTDLVRKEMVGPLTDQQKNFLDVVRRNLDRMNVLISDLSDINRVESGRMKFELGHFDLAEVVTDVVGNMEEVIAGKNQTITTKIPPNLPQIHADKNRVAQILTNLVSNAHKYSEDKDSIWVNVGLEKGLVKVGVLDNGLGISPENQAKLFTQFFRAEDEKVREQTGWGLGLSIVKMMVEAQGGEIGFESVYREGSLFWFTLPVKG